jgi:LruC domain-containing protein
MKHGSIILIILILVGCDQRSQDHLLGTDTEERSVETMLVPPEFSYSTTQEIQLDLQSLGTRNAAVGGVVFSVLTAPRNNGGKSLLNGMTDGQGSFSGSFALATSNGSVVIATDHAGLVNESELTIAGGYLSGTFGSGSNGIDTYVDAELSLSKAEGYAFSSIGSWGTSGVPMYLEPTPDVIDAGLLSRITQSLPERSSVPENNPGYIDGVDKSTILNEEADVYVTFIHEGAGYRNVLGFYTYDPLNPPQTTADIDTVTVIFPNVSFVGSGGGLRSGDKVNIGRYPAGTAIGWVVLSNGFLNSGVSPGAGIVYSTNALNPGAQVTDQQHIILLNDIGFDRVILAVEDMYRTINGSDEDFNDVIFALSTSPATAMNTENTTPLSSPSDSDGDGVSDLLDEFPEEPDKAFTTHEPSSGTYGSLAFEDLWPGLGDYDFNDLVLAYSFKKTTNARNEVVEFDATIVVNAVGAGFRNGFAIELPVSPSSIASVTGGRSTGSMFPLAGNGTEQGVAKAVLPIFDDAYDVMLRPGGYYVNTELNAPYITPETLQVEVRFVSPIPMNEFGSAPYNPFIVVNGDRGHEIHLPDHEPTVKASLNLFGMYSDGSKPSSGKYYISKRNHPWVLHIPNQFDYPVEYTKLSDAHLKFVHWAESGGALYKDWYSNTNGYRHSNAIWKR